MLERRYRETESEMIRTELSALLAEGTVDMQRNEIKQKGIVA